MAASGAEGVRGTRSTPLLVVVAAWLLALVCAAGLARVAAHEPPARWRVASTGTADRDDPSEPAGNAAVDDTRPAVASGQGIQRRSWSARDAQARSCLAAPLVHRAGVELAYPASAQAALEAARRWSRRRDLAPSATDERFVYGARAPPPATV